MLTDLKTILDHAEAGSYAVPAFNIYNLETVMGATAAAEELRSPLILQCYSRLFTNEEGYLLAPVILAAARKASVPVCFHLDHGASELETTRAIRFGCTGIMIDASALDFENNIALTRRVTETAAFAGIPVEGELGHIGSTGEILGDFTDPAEASVFVKQTGVTALAVLVGSAHGHYKKPPRLDIERIAQIKSAACVPLVLHGGSGIPDEQVKAAIEAGIRKVNFGTELCCAFLDKIFETSRDKIAVDVFMKDAVAAVKDFVSEKIKLLGAAGKYE